MPASFIAIGFFVVVVVVLVGFAVVGFLNSDSMSSRKRLREARAEALDAKSREKIATKALRAISNGSGNPVLEAQIALDTIDQTYTKELNS